MNCRTLKEPATFQANKVGGRWRIDPDVDLESLSNPMNERVREERILRKRTGERKRGIN